MTVVAGVAQTGTVGAPLDTALTVFVSDKFGNPAPGALVRFTAAAGAGSLTPLTVTTGSDGHAQTHWTLPTLLGTYHATASVSGLDSLVFQATAVAATPMQLSLLTPDTVGGDAGGVADSAIVVQLHDGFGNPVGGGTLTLQAVGGGTAPATVLTDSLGHASVTWSLGGVPGINTLTIGYTGLPAVQVTGIGFPALPRPGLSVGSVSACRLTAAGAAECWGPNGAGQLGTGDTQSRSLPTPVVTALLFESIATGGPNAGEGQSCGLVTDGTAYCWGTIGTSVYLTPTAVVGHQFVSISVGLWHVCGVTANGSGYCWGRNSSGQLGDRTTSTRDTPTAIAGGLRFRQLVAGGEFTCGLTRAGAVYCWGSDLNGQMGHGTIASASQLTPLSVASGMHFQSISGGGATTCAADFSGATVCWGANYFGEATAGPGPPNATPTVVAGLAGLAPIVIGSGQACALDGTGIASCWGSNGFLARGDSVFASRAAPAPILGGYHFVELAAGQYSTCGRTMGNAIYCWGLNDLGSVGVSDTTTRLSPKAVAGGVLFTSISTGLIHSCGLDGQGQGYCWGDNRLYPLVGDGSGAPRVIPTPVAGGHQFTRLRAGGYAACGLDTQGAAWCWGQGSHGEIGDGGLNDQAMPTQVGGGHQFTELDVEFEQACGLTSNGEIWCWGAGDVIKNTGPYPLPVKVTATEPMTSISVGTRLACGMGQSGAVLCWFPSGDSVSPVADTVSGAPALTSITAGFYGACGLTANGDAWCWSSINGGTGVPTLVPGGHQFASLENSWAGQTTCGVTTAGAGYCWGDNSGGKFGDGTMTSKPDPTLVSGGQQFQQLAPSSFHTCGLLAGGAAYCWGTSSQGALGTGDSHYHPYPLLVSP
ncbi:MAG: Ig-like domain-containing protein [Gemmatimonadota bacterium]